MTAEEFRALALSLPDTIESSHMRHPDFRVGGKIFATLGYPSPEWGMVGLTLEEQARVSQAEPDAFVPIKNAWGRAGATQVYLHLARKSSVRAALRAAWQNRVMKNATATGRKPVKGESFGLTLIELLFAIALVAILAALVIAWIVNQKN